MNPSNCIISFNTKIFDVLFFITSIPIALICVTGFIVLLTGIKQQKTKKSAFSMVLVSYNFIGFNCWLPISLDLDVFQVCSHPQFDCVIL